MGLFDKLKTLLYDVEEVEVEKKIPVEESKPASPVIMNRETPKGIGVQPDIKRTIPLPSKPIVKPEQVEQKREEIDDVVSERELFKSDSTFKFPVVFEEKDFVSEGTPYNKNNIINATNNKIRQQRISNVDKSQSTAKVFKPSPIISPVYGILDKNYKKEDVTLADESSYEVPRQKKIDFDTVRKKAYGTLTDDLEDTLIMDLQEELNPKKEGIEEEKDLIEIDEINDKEVITVNELEELLDNEEKSEITIGEAHENYSDYGKSYNHETLKDIEKEVKLETIEPIEITNNESERSKKDKQKDLDLTDDLFNLINSMYDEE